MEEIVLGRDALRDAEWLEVVQSKAWGGMAELGESRPLVTCAGDNEDCLQAQTVIGPAIAAMAPRLGLKKQAGKWVLGEFEERTCYLDHTGIVVEVADIPALSCRRAWVCGAILGVGSASLPLIVHVALGGPPELLLFLAPIAGLMLICGCSKIRARHLWAAAGILWVLEWGVYQGWAPGGGMGSSCISTMLYVGPLLAWLWGSLSRLCLGWRLLWATSERKGVAEKLQNLLGRGMELGLPRFCCPVKVYR